MANKLDSQVINMVKIFVNSSYFWADDGPEISKNCVALSSLL